MCACDERPGYTCHKHSTGCWVDADMNLREWLDWKQEREDRLREELSRPDFQKPFGEAA